MKLFRVTEWTLSIINDTSARLQYYNSTVYRTYLKNSNKTSSLNLVIMCAYFYCRNNNKYVK